MPDNFRMDFDDILLGYVRNGKRKKWQKEEMIEFCDALDHYLDLLDP